MMSNLYWSVYKNLERELIKLSDMVYFCDKQNGVYSLHIADLLVRTAIEIEAISKKIYQELGGNMQPIDAQGDPRSLYFDSDCIQLMDIKWKITKKIVNISAANFYFEKEENLILRPLKDCNKQGAGRWKKAYQSVKHDRYGSLEAGNIANLIRAMASLFVLNLYYKDASIYDLNAGSRPDLSMGSEVFSVNSYKATSLNMTSHMNEENIVTNDKDERDTAVFIEKYTDESFLEMHKNYMADSQIAEENMSKSVEIKEFLARHPESASKSINEICMLCGEEIERNKLGIREGQDETEEQREQIYKAGTNMLLKIMSFSHTMNGKPAKSEVILNKCQTIYPVV